MHGSVRRGSTRPRAFCSHQSCLPNPSQSHRLPRLQSEAFLPHFLLFHSHYWFTHQFSFLTVHPQAQLLQPKAPPTGPADPSCSSAGFLWGLGLDSRQSRQGRQGKWAPFHPRHAVMPDGLAGVPAILGGRPWEAVGGKGRSAVPGRLPRGGTDTTHRPARLQRRGERHGRASAPRPGQCPTAEPVPHGSQGEQAEPGRLVASPTCARGNGDSGV